MKNKHLLFLVALTFLSFQGFSQIPEGFLKTWYLESFSSPQGETFVNTLDVSQGPSFTPTEDLFVTGNSFCNDFNGNYIYVNPEPLADNHTFRPTSIIRDNIGCGSNKAIETLFYEPFLNESEGDIFFIEDGFIVIQYYHPVLNYQTFRDEPVLNIEENTLNAIQLFPNPTTGIFQIGDGSEQIDFIKIYNTQGALVKSFEQVFDQIDISEFDTGVYFMLIKSEKKSAVRRIVKE